MTPRQSLLRRSRAWGVSIWLLSPRRPQGRFGSWLCEKRFYTARVKNGCGARSTGTSAVPQIADDIGAPRKWSEVGPGCVLFHPAWAIS